jgi:GNAT superfamily N-acetyltransferase
LTIYELPSALFQRCKPLYAQAWFDVPVLDAVFEGRQAARLFVDDTDAPTAAIMCRTYEYFIAGTPESPLRTFIKEAPEEPNVFQHLYGYTPIGEAWTQALLEDVKLLVIPRRNFQWEAGTPAPDVPVPDGARIERVDHTLSEQVDRELPVPFLQIFWGSREALVENGFAYCALQDGVVASTIYAVAASRTGILVGIDTTEQFRRRGYGTAVSAAFIREALQRGMLPYWDTDLENLPSAAMAQKLGFVEHEPFKELRAPDFKLPMTSGVWSRGDTRADGVTEWVRRVGNHVIH